MTCPDHHVRVFTPEQHFCHILLVQCDRTMPDLLTQCVAFLRLMLPHVAYGVGWLKRRLHVTNN